MTVLHKDPIGWSHQKALQQLKYKITQPKYAKWECTNIFSNYIIFCYHNIFPQSYSPGVATVSYINTFTCYIQTLIPKLRLINKNNVEEL